MASKKRKCLSIREKVDIIREIESGARNVDVCKKYKLPSSTVSTIIRNKQLYISSFRDNVTGAKKIRSCNYIDLDRELFQWLKIQRSYGMPVDGRILRTQAVKIAKDLGHYDFNCSNGWLSRFKNRHHVRFAVSTILFII